VVPSWFSKSEKRKLMCKLFPKKKIVILNPSICMNVTHADDLANLTP
jgi:hypothetical protein